MGETQSPIPDSSSIEFFKEISSKHGKISSVKASKDCDQIFYINRRHGDTISVYLTNLYTIGIADYLDIRNNYPEVNCIVTVSAWNGYTSGAKNIALKDRVGLFVMPEYMGAMNVQRFWAYVKKDDKGEPLSFGGRA